MSDSEPESQKEKEKHCLSVKRSQGADRKLTSFKKYCNATGYMGLVLLKPTWPRGKPRAMVTKNFSGQILVPKSGLDGVGVGMAELESFNTGDENVDNDTLDCGGDVMGSPRSARPLGEPSKKAKGKRPRKTEVVRCHACGEVYDERCEDEGILWIFCGGPGPRGNGCRAFAAHATCWNISGGKNVLELMSRKFVRCKDCQEIENNTSGDEDDDVQPEQSSNAGKRKPSAKKPSASKQSSSSADQSSSSANQQTNRGASKSNSQSGSRRVSPPTYPSDDDFVND